MMAGLVHVLVGPTGFLVGFTITEVSALLSVFIARRFMPMVEKVVRFVKERAVEAWGSHFPLSGVTPLTSP